MVARQLAGGLAELTAKDAERLVIAYEPVWAIGTGRSATAQDAAAMAAAIRRLNEAGVPVIVVTNQSGVARNIFPESLVHQVHQKMISELAAGGARIDAIYFCPHKTEDACECRKPNPGLLERAAREHALDLAGSWIVGDRYADLEMGQVAGTRGILVMTGYGRGEYELHHKEWPRQPDVLAENLTEAVSRILHD